MIQHILFPVDFSEPCARIAPAVRTWAQRTGARVTLLHAFEGPGIYSIENVPLATEVRQLRDAGARQITAYQADTFAGLTVNRLQVEAGAAHAVVDYAANNQVDLIMMPTLGYTRFRQLLLGSVTASVLHDSEVPVWTSAHTEDSRHNPAPTSIVCAVDCSPQTEHVVRWAVATAKAFQVPLKVINVRPVPAELFASGVAQSAHEFNTRVVLEDYQQATRGIPGAPPLEIIEDAHIVSGVNRVIEREQADLLIIGRGKIQGFLGRLRTNAHNVIREAPCAVVSV